MGKNKIKTQIVLKKNCFNIYLFIYLYKITSILSTLVCCSF